MIPRTSAAFALTETVIVGFVVLSEPFWPKAKSGVRARARMSAFFISVLWVVNANRIVAVVHAMGRMWKLAGGLSDRASRRLRTGCRGEYLAEGLTLR